MSQWRKKTKRPRINAAQFEQQKQHPAQHSERVGHQSEQLVEAGLQILIDQGHIYGFYRTKRGGELDQGGVDFQIYVSRHRIMNLQVKSSAIGRDKHVTLNNDLIPCIVAHRWMTLEDLAEAIRAEIERTFLVELEGAIARAKKS